MNRPADGSVPRSGRETMPEDDRELMLRAGSGSREAFEALVDRWEGRLIGFFFRQSRDRDLAEDCAQEVFVRLYRSRDRYTPDSRFATFLFTIARNHWIDVARARKVRPDLQPRRGAAAGGTDDERSDPMQALPSSEPAPAERAALDDDLARLHAALRKLPESLRSVVELGVLQALPYSEVSELLSIPVGTVKSRVHSAVQSLRILLRTADAPVRAGGEPKGEGP